jgi:transposase
MKLKTYTPEFRAEAVKLVLAQGLSQEEAAQRIGIPKGTLANWVSAAKRSMDPTAAPGSRSVAELEAELVKLRKELAVERMEKEVLKNRPTRSPVALMNRNSQASTLAARRAVAVSFLEA